MTEGAIRGGQVKFERKKRGRTAFSSNTVKAFRRTAGAIFPTSTYTHTLLRFNYPEDFDATAGTPLPSSAMAAQGNPKGAQNVLQGPDHEKIVLPTPNYNVDPQYFFSAPHQVALSTPWLAS